MSNNTEQKTLQDFKDEVAKEYSFKNWDDAELYESNTIGGIVQRMEEAAKRYAQHRSWKAWEEGNISGRKCITAPYPECVKYDINPYTKQE